MRKGGMSKLLWVVLGVAVLVLGWQFLGQQMFSGGAVMPAPASETEDAQVENYNGTGYRSRSNPMTGQSNIGETDNDMLAHSHGMYASF